ncbi:DUF2290 domain-containing protein [Bacillus altitudinis]|uniref:DUF2290 domain-containing protein n=1 Tax=Bacillus altitudinis TaxID=293387 RepID=UPI003D1F1CC3
MIVASLLDSLNDAKRILKWAEVYKETNKSRKMSLDFSKFSVQFISKFQGSDYDLIYKTAMQNMDYDFLLVDDSFFQFSCTVMEGASNNISVRYAYYENPRSYITYIQFLESIDLTYKECGDELLLEYEQEIDESRLKHSVTPFRYDYDFKSYDPIHHPVSHIHIGHNNNVRIAFDKVMTPAKFVMFVLRNTYRKQWKNAFQQDRFRDLCLSTKNSCIEIDDSLFKREERDFLFLT